MLLVGEDSSETSETLHQTTRRYIKDDSLGFLHVEYMFKAFGILNVPNQRLIPLVISSGYTDLVHETSGRVEKVQYVLSVYFSLAALVGMRHGFGRVR